MTEWSDDSRAEVREAMQRCSSRYDWGPMDPVDPATMHAPPAHGVALAFDRPLVVGGRGTGKSYWAAALCQPDARERLRCLYPRTQLPDRCFFGFAGRLGGDDPYTPTADELRELSARVEPHRIWRAVFSRYLIGDRDASLQSVHNSGATGDREFRQRLVTARGGPVLMVCDALDRLSQNWSDVRSLCQGLLRLALDLRGFNGASVKVFLRRDQFEDSELFDFPDASKLRTGSAELDWEDDDLYGLLFQGMEAELGQVTWQQHFASLVPGTTNLGPQAHRRAFEHLAGEFMGSDRRRGRTYTWVTKHLADTSGRASPRSFIVAMNRAAGSVGDRTPIDPKGIHEGVRAASKARVDELREDHPWLDAVLRDMEGLVVPCSPEDFKRRWRDRGTLGRIRDTPTSARIPNVPLSFARADAGEDDQALLDALITLRVVEIRKTTNRINVPDVYRVAAGIGRRGGVAIPRR